MLHGKTPSQVFFHLYSPISICKIVSRSLRRVGETLNTGDAELLDRLNHFTALSAFQTLGFKASVRPRSCIVNRKMASRGSLVIVMTGRDADDVVRVLEDKFKGSNYAIEVGLLGFSFWSRINSCYSEMALDGLSNPMMELVSPMFQNLFGMECLFAANCSYRRSSER